MATIHSIADCPPFPEVDGVELRHVPGFPGYAVGDDGSILSCHPWRLYPKEWRHLVDRTDAYGYRSVSLRKNNKTRLVKVARLVLEAFRGPCPRGHEVCHGNGTRIDDRLSNLRWGTRSDNVQDALRHGTMANLHRIGELNPRSKLTDEERNILIPKLYGYLTQVEIGDLFGMASTSISSILSGRYADESYRQAARDRYQRRKANAGN